MKKFSQPNNTINFTIVSYSLEGQLQEVRKLKMNDLNLCNRVSSPAHLWNQSFKFGANFRSKCTVNLKELIDLQAATKFSTIYLNFFDKGANFVQTIPIVNRNAFEVNKVSSHCYVHATAPLIIKTNLSL